jgi:nucleoside 2-deoxyribosyltransferase
MSKRLFVSSPLSTLAEQNLNATLAAIVREVGYDCYLPQEHLPPGGGASPRDIFHHNVTAVQASDVVLCVLDKPGSGVIFELAYAFALSKPTIVFRSDKQDYLGKLIEGFWETTAPDCRATTLAELRAILQRLNAAPAPNTNGARRHRLSAVPS